MAKATLEPANLHDAVGAPLVWPSYSTSIFDTEETSYVQHPPTHVLNWVSRYVPALESTPAERVERVREARAAKELLEFEAKINNSLYMLDFEDDWDEDGAKAISRETWNRATKFARQVEEWSARYRSLCLGQFSISPVHSGGIDLFWENEFCDLLVNVPASGNLGTYHGENRRGEVMAGAVDLDEAYPELIISWLRKRRS